MLRWILLAACALLAAAAPARASCASALVVDGHVLSGVARFDRSALPPVADEVEAIYPACNDGGQELQSDADGTASRLDGIPPTLAVLDSAGELFYDADTLVITDAHPLQDAVFRERPPDPAPCPTLRRRRVRADYVSGTTLRAGGQGQVFRLLARTVIDNRPPTARILEGQRLRLLVSACHRRPAAERIHFVGATVAPGPYQRYVAPGTSSPSAALLFVLVVALVGIALIGGFGWLLWATRY